jgi:hypothetical protein
VTSEPIDDGWLSRWFQDRYDLAASVGVLVERLAEVDADLECQGDG